MRCPIRYPMHYPIRVLLAVLFLFLTTPVWADTYVVRPDGTGDFPNIQFAVNAAQNGDIIELTDGVFTGNYNRDIVFDGKSLTIRSQSGNPQACVIDCEREGRGFFGHLSGWLEGFTVTHGLGGEWGGAINIYEGSLSVHNCIFSENEAPGNGGAIFIDLCAVMSFSKCTFENNSGGPGGAICT